MARSRTNRSPALIASAALHGAVAVLAILAWQLGSKKANLGDVVSVQIINGPPAEPAPAIPAPEPTPATAEEPDPTATTPPAAPTPPTPEPQVQQKQPPTPQPPVAQPKQQPPTPQPPAGKPTAQATAKPAPKGVGKPAKGLNLDQLAQAIASGKPQTPARRFSLADLEASLRKGRGAKGPNRPRAAPEAGAGTTDRASASSVGALGQRLGQLWNPNCDVEGAAGINIKVRVHVAPGGTLASAPELVDPSIDPLGASLVSAAAHRALSATVRGAPFTELPGNFAGDIVLNFNAKQACSMR